MSLTLAVVAGVVALVSVIMSHRARSTETFFAGRSASGAPPRLLTLVFSQVTTWIFARSLMNAAILGFYYGIWGTLAYAFYYLSFITGGLIIDSVRFRHGFESIQGFLNHRFGRAGTVCYNLVVGVRLVSEVFANLLVVGILFGVAGTSLYTAAILAFALATLLYAMLGGLHASLRTDLFQMMVFLLTLVALVTLVAVDGAFTGESLLFVPFELTDPRPHLDLGRVVANLELPDARPGDDGSWISRQSTDDMAEFHARRVDQSDLYRRVREPWYCRGCTGGGGRSDDYGVATSAR